MAGKVIAFGDVTARHEVEELLAQRHPDVQIDSAGHSWEFVERACSAAYDVALLLQGPIAQHQQRVDAVGSLRRNSFKGKILVAASFLTERHEATEAGADHVFDSDRQPVEQVVAAALFRPTSAADHPYLRHLLVGEWTTTQAYRDDLPVEAPNLLLAATSCHEDPGFFKRLAEYTVANPDLHCILVEDGGAEDVEVEALSSGVRPYVVLAEEGLAKVASLARTFLREAWLRNVTKA